MSEVTEITAPPEVLEVPAVMPPDWRAGLSILEQQRHMLESGLGADCSFVVGSEDGDTQVFRAHKFVMYRASPVFEAMFLREMDEARSSEVKVTDVQPDIFKKLLEHTYTDEVTFGSLEEAAGLAVAADKYLLLPLRAASLAYVRDKVDAHFVWRAVQLADLMMVMELNEECSKVLQRDTLSCVSGSGFLEASEEGVALLLAQDVTQLGSEMALISAVEGWARHQAQARDKTVREILEPCLLSKLRFLSLTLEQFITGPYLATWLSADEKESIRENLSELGKVALPDIICKNTKQRRSFNVEENEAVKPPVPSGLFACTLPICKPTENKLVLSSITTVLPICVDNDIWLLYIILPSQIRSEDVLRHNIQQFSISDDGKTVYRENVLVTLSENIVRKTDPRNKNGYYNLESRTTEVIFAENVNYNSRFTVKFPQPMLLRKCQLHAVRVQFNRKGYYSTAPRSDYVRFGNVDFTFSEIKEIGSDTRDGFIHTINFTARDV